MLVGGGQGLRLGAQQAKALVPLLGKPLAAHALERLSAALRDVGVVLVLPEEAIALWEAYCATHSVAPHQVVCGENTRQKSVQAGLKALGKSQGLVGVHDVARPLTPAAVWQRGFASLHPPNLPNLTFDQKEVQAAVPVLPMIDSLRKKIPAIQGNQQQTTMACDRALYYAVQTPQVFQLEVLCQAHEQANIQDAGDDASLVEALGLPISTFQGDPLSLKITHPHDLTWCAHQLKSCQT